MVNEQKYDIDSGTCLNSSNKVKALSRISFFHSEFLYYRLTRNKAR